jgi:RimJ/RimL family protein N-acetyltransferase
MLKRMHNTMTVRIEPQIAAHADGLYDALQDERIYKFLDDAPPNSVGAVRERIERLLQGPPASSGEVWMNWTVFEGAAVVGYTQATIRKDGTASLAYVLSPTVWGRSVGHAACVLTLADLRDRTSVVKVVADTEAQNDRSQALLDRLGFRRTHADGQDVFYELTFE